MNFSLHRGPHRIWGSQPVGAEEVALKLIVKRFFVPDREGGAWLEMVSLSLAPILIKPKIRDVPERTLHLLRTLTSCDLW